jgi:hypothetical protein
MAGSKPARKASRRRRTQASWPTATDPDPAAGMRENATWRGGGVRWERPICSTAGVRKPSSFISQSSRPNHSVGRANACVPMLTSRVVPTLSNRTRCTYQRRTSTSSSTGTDIPSTGSITSSLHTGAIAGSRCTRRARPPRSKAMSNSDRSAPHPAARTRTGHARRGQPSTPGPPPSGTGDPRWRRALTKCAGKDPTQTDAVPTRSHRWPHSQARAQPPAPVAPAIKDL